MQQNYVDQQQMAGYNQQIYGTAPGYQQQSYNAVCGVNNQVKSYPQMQQDYTQMQPGYQQQNVYGMPLPGYNN